MINVLITGINSYVGNGIDDYLKDFNHRNGREYYRIDKMSLRDAAWENNDFSKYNVVLHVAGIAHADVSNLSEAEQKAYYDVNCKLAEKVGIKARKEGVKQFVYFSSVIIYGESGKVGRSKVIDLNTVPQPCNFYGDSKWQGEKAVRELQTDNFRVAILRLPMIYGKNSKGNFKMLIKVASVMPVFPWVENNRSMLYIENLAEFVRRLMENGCGGVFYPQNAEYVTTAEMMKMICKYQQKKIFIWKFLNPMVKVVSIMPGKIGKLANKVFGSLVIAKELSENVITGYQIYSLEESIKKSVSK